VVDRFGSQVKLLDSIEEEKWGQVGRNFTLTSWLGSWHNEDMQSIELPDAKYQKLSQQAAAAGYDDVAAFVEALADEAAFDPRCEMTDAELRQSAAECNRINEAMKAGAGHDAREALQKLGNELGYNKTST